MARPLEPGATRSRYSGGAIAFHWTIAILVIANIAIALVTDDWHGPSRAAAMQIHKATGFTVLVLSIGRLIWRLLHRPPPFPPEIRAWEAIVARLVHWSFYVLMIALPLSGWLMISAAGQRKPFSWYGLFGLPYLPVQGSKVVDGLSHEAHEVLGYAFIVLIALHVAGALKHQFLDGSRFINRMWPGRAAAR